MDSVPRVTDCDWDSGTLPGLPAGSLEGDAVLLVMLVCPCQCPALPRGERPQRPHNSSCVSISQPPSPSLRALLPLLKACVPGQDSCVTADTALHLWEPRL